MQSSYVVYEREQYVFLQSYVDSTDGGLIPTCPRCQNDLSFKMGSLTAKVAEQTGVPDELPLLV